MEKHAYGRIATDQISTDFPYSVRYRLEDISLKDSVTKHGVLTPLWVSADHPRVLISGHRRFIAARSLGHPSIPVHELAGSHSPKQLFIYAILANLNQAWSELDRVCVLKKARQDFGLSESEILNELLPALSLDRAAHVLRGYERISQLHPLLLDEIQCGHLPFRGAQILDGLRIEDQRIFAEYIVSHAALTTSELLQVGEWLCDLIRDRRMSLDIFLKSEKIEVMLQDMRQNRRWKGEQLCRRLRELRFPRLTGCEREFRSLAHEICGDIRDIKVEASPSFEQEGYTLQARVRNSQSLEHLLNLLREKQSSLNSLFDFML